MPSTITVDLHSEMGSLNDTEVKYIKSPSKDIDTDTCLGQISPFFNVKKTKYGGRGCFAISAIPKGTVLLTCNKPISSTIIKPFRKEACTRCFSYCDGRILKTKIQKKFGKEIVSLYFCSEECKEEFTNDDIDNLYADSLLEIERHYIAGLNKPEMELKEPSKTADLQSVIKQEWEEVALWEKKIRAMKPTKRASQIFRISDSEYTEIKYVIGVLFHMYKCSKKQVSLPIKYINELDNNERNQLELQLFNILQSSEPEKVQKYPYLLYSYINIYKFLVLTTLPPLQDLVSSDLVRATIGRNLSNAFGIWSEASNPSEEKEFFGFGVYPSASYFNHSCGPNMIKKRTKNVLTFTTLQDIKPDQELCIDYGNYINEKVEVRRRELSEWFFDCGCDKCTVELQSQ
ncbi:uncharacterized protein RJT20DRAFT_125681 [Scheffersomyces xylosifermentans]|uniref:uncharacterized protein n=1 Tax=Scheffersomyces xylosifermentans TaxID=1304137 RepID=UPI00315DD5FD